MSLPITFTSSPRSRHLSIVINTEGEVTVRMPPGFSESRALAFVASKKSWIEKTLAKMRRRQEKYKDALRLPKGNRKDLVRLKGEALKLVKEKMEFFNKEFYGGRFTWKRLTIRNTKTRWGSCSKQGNVSFNYRIVMLPAALADYLVVHELCHLGEMNHGRGFWDLVAVAVPEYKRLSKELRRVKSSG